MATSIASSSVFDQEVAAAGDAGVHLRPAHLLERDLLADHHLGHPRRAEVHRGVALAHDHDVAEGRDVGAAGGRGPEQQADLRHPAGEPHLVVEDPPGAAAAREHLHLVGDPRAGRVDQVDHRHLELQRPLLDPEDLLDRLRPPRARLHGRVVGHQRDLAAADQRQAGDHAVGAQALLRPSWRAAPPRRTTRDRPAARPARAPAACPARRSSRGGAPGRPRGRPRAPAELRSRSSRSSPRARLAASSRPRPLGVRQRRLDCSVSVGGRGLSSARSRCWRRGARRARCDGARISASTRRRAARPRSAITVSMSARGAGSRPRSIRSRLALGPPRRPRGGLLVGLGAGRLGVGLGVLATVAACAYVRRPPSPRLARRTSSASICARRRVGLGSRARSSALAAASASARSRLGSAARAPRPRRRGEDRRRSAPRCARARCGRRSQRASSPPPVSSQSASSLEEPVDLALVVAAPASAEGRGCGCARSTVLVHPRRPSGSLSSRRAGSVSAVQDRPAPASRPSSRRTRARTCGRSGPRSTSLVSVAGAAKRSSP